MIIKPAPFFMAVTFLGGMILVALIMSHYQRETTSIEEKYQHRSADEIDATYNDPLAKISNSAYYNDNVTPHSTGIIGLFLPDDQDHDGLSNYQERSSLLGGTGTDSQNPDTDGDGTSDGIEIMLGTDPLNKDSGGVTFPPAPPTPPVIPLETKELIINIFYKNAKNPLQPEAKWSHYTDAAVGDKLSFLIYMELTNTSTDPTFAPPAQLTDQLSKEFTYTPGSSYIRFNNAETLQQMDDNWITQGQSYTISIPPNVNPQKPVPIEITFEAKLSTVPADQIRLTNNQATLKTPTAEVSDTAVITIK